MSTKAKAAIARICAGREPPENDDLAKTLAGEARRVALLVWWGTYTEDEARDELRALYRIHAVEICAEMDEAADAAYGAAFAGLAEDFTRKVTDLAWQTQQRLMSTGGDMAAAAASAISLARDLRPMLPPYLVEDAIAAAKQNYDHCQREKVAAMAGWARRRQRSAA